MNSEKSKTSDTHRLLLNFSDKLNLKGKNDYVALSNLSIYYARKRIKKKQKKLINIKYKLRHGMNNLN